MSNASFKTASHLFLLCAITFVIYLPGLSGGFYFDDEWNILNNVDLRISELSFASLENAASSGQSGPLGRPIAMLSFAFNYYFSEFSPFTFKMTNLVIHLFSGVGVYFLAFGLASRLDKLEGVNTKTIALLVAALWLFHPVNLSPVLYVVQRMAGLSALFCIWGLVAYVFGRQLVEAGRVSGYKWIGVAYMVFFPLGLFSKENAALFPLYCFLIEIVFFNFNLLKRGEKKALLLIYTCLLLLPTIFIVSYILIKPGYISSGYEIRDFNMGERLLTESRVLLLYIKQILLPISSDFGLFHDDIKISRSLKDPWTTSISIVILVGMVLSGLFYIRKSPVYAFGVLFFLSAHIMESSVLSLELMHEHRNYLASFSMIFMVLCFLAIKKNTGELKNIKSIMMVLALLYVGFLTHMRANIWSDPNVHAFEEVKNHPQSARSNYQVGRIFASYGHHLDDVGRKEDYFNKATLYFKKSSEVNKSYTDGLFGLLMLEAIEGKKIGEEFGELLDRLENSPFHHNNYNYLSALFACLSNGVCQLEFNKVEAIINACKENPLFRGEHRENIMRYYSLYSGQ